MHILVTGGAGFIGSHLVDALLEDGHDVTVFDNLSTGCRDQIPTEARFVEGDIRDEAALQALFEEGRFDVVFHEAAQTQVSYSLAHPREDAELNVIGLINVLEQCRRQGVQKFIYSSSAAVYGDNPKVPLSESEPLAPASFYGLTKVAAEKYIQLYGSLFGLPYAILRYANVYGERQGNGGEGGVVGLFARALACGQDLTIFGDGEQSRDFVYVKDVARANIAAMDSGVPSGIYNISTQIETTINALKEILLYFSHAGVAVSYGEARKGDIFRSSLTNGKAIETLRWRPKMKLMPGLMATYQYFLERRKRVKEDSNHKFYLVREDILPEAIKKTIKVKEILKHHQTRTINEAVRMMDLSRSAYYKYKDYVFPFYDVTQGKIVTLSVMIFDRPGELSQVLNTVAANNGSILTINQGIPLQGMADVSLSIETKDMTVPVDELIKTLEKLSGVSKVDIIGQA